MKYNCPDCHAIASVYWSIATPEIWRCEACRTLLHPQEIKRLTEVTNEPDSSQATLPLFKAG